MKAPEGKKEAETRRRRLKKILKRVALLLDTWRRMG